jgi:hypothetical protein
MNQLIENLNKGLQSNRRKFRCNGSLLLSDLWSCELSLNDLKNVKFKLLITFYNGIAINWNHNKITITENSHVLLSTAVISLPEDGKVFLSLALKEGFIRLLNSNGTDGTWKGKAISLFESEKMFLDPAHVLSLQEGPKLFEKHEALKNMTGLDFWFVPHKDCFVFSGTNNVGRSQSQNWNNISLIQNDINKAPIVDSKDGTIFFEPNKYLEYHGNHFNWLFDSNHNMILFLAIEPYEYVSPLEEQTIFKITQGKNTYSLMYTRTKEEIGDYRNREYTYRFFIKHQYITDKSYQTTNFVDLFTTQWIYKNERPGPSIYFLITQQIKDNQIKIQNYNYNKKWFIFEELKKEINPVVSNEPSYFKLGGEYHGKIKELFIFNREIHTENIFDDQSIKWIMAYLKYKYAIEEKLIDLKK